MIDVLAIISRLQEEKRKDNVNPTHVLNVELLREVNEEVKKEINLLVKAGEIGWCETCNDKAFYQIDL